MKKGGTWFLRLVLVGMAIVALAVCIFALPSIFTGVPAEYPIVTSTLYLCVVGLYVSVIPFSIAWYESWKLLRYIDTNTAFSEKSLNALRSIKYSAIAMSISYAAAIPLLFQVAELDDAPGLGAIALAFTCIPLVVSTFAAVLEKLLQNAIDIQSENDLTV